MIYFTADEHYGHKNIIEYCTRPFGTVQEMDEVIIQNHNAVVKDTDLTIHAGDFTLKRGFNAVTRQYINRLKGQHIFLEGSHDYWLKGNGASQIWAKKIDVQYFVVCHYAMRTWARSHYNSFQLFGHSHGSLNKQTFGKSFDIGVDSHNFNPWSTDEVVEKMRSCPDNFNFLAT